MKANASMSIDGSCKVSRQFKNVIVVSIEWEGPFKFQDVLGKNPKMDCKGLYQIYISHPIFGRDSLNYIGQTESQTFAIRLRQHWENGLKYENEVTFFLGRLSTDDSDKLSAVENLAIFRNQPPGNSSAIVAMLVDFPLIVQNFGDYGSLLHEFTSFRMPPGEGIYPSWNQYLHE